jgi:hypothetical protein
VKRGTTDHPKVYELMERVGCDRPTAIGLLEMLWHFTAKYAPQGDIGRFSDARIEAGMDWGGRGKPKGKLIKALVDSKWIDANQKHRLVIHDWNDHVDETTRKKLNRSGLSCVAVRAKVSGQNADTIRTNPASVAENGCLPDPDPDPGPGPGPGPGPDADISPTFERIYARHPKKQGMQPAMAAFIEALGQSPEPEAEAARIEQSHAAWVDSIDWRREGGKYAPRLDRWFREKGYKDAVPEFASEPQYAGEGY